MISQEAVLEYVIEIEEDVVLDFTALEKFNDVIVFLEQLPLHRQLKVKRVVDNLTSTFLAKYLQMGISTLSDIEAGRRKIPFKHLRKIEDYLYHQYWFDGAYVGPIDK
ncbi:helix-turn-helix transcriptional regulator [Bacillaceae bacterium IKA-2]|nr:helix-turn-helix transcriptional regulator [Bacillaceae bacterium IKA-2]